MNTYYWSERSKGDDVKIEVIAETVEQAREAVLKEIEQDSTEQAQDFLKSIVAKEPEVEPVTFPKVSIDWEYYDWAPPRWGY